MSTESWPPALKEWVAKCLGQMTDSNRPEAQAELRQVISDAFQRQALWTTDWAGMQLTSLVAKPPPVIGSKRKSADSLLPNNKKTKKNNTKLHAVDHLNDQAALNRRAERFQREHDIERNKTFQSHSKHNNSYNNSLFNRTTYVDNVDEPEADPMDWERHRIVGTSTELFKDYLRLTSEPNPETIRPYHILKSTLDALKLRWKEKCQYQWICSQFKSLRQDLTVQRIKNEFTVQVYEIHARIALEKSDMVEYNQCQGMLKTLYDMGIPGKVEEFTAYRILMFLHGRNRTELNLYVGQLTSKQKSDPAVKHALDVQRAMAMGNYHKFFDLYLSAPNMGAYIMDHFIARERVRTLLVVTKVYMQLSLSFLKNELAFDTFEDTRLFLAEHSADVFRDARHPDSQKILECKPAHPKLLQAYEEKYTRVQIKGAI